MGNLNIKGYTPSSKTSFKGGCGKIWNIFPAKKSNKTGSIFVFEKKKYKTEGLQRDKKEQNFEIMRREAKNLSKYMHPSVLKIMEPLYEDANLIGFVTEPIEYSLEQLLIQKREEPIRSDETELKLILMELLEGISYLADVRTQIPTIKSTLFFCCLSQRS